MNPNPQFWNGKRVCVTGGTGFLGWHLARLLAPLASHVRILGLRPASQQLGTQLQAFDCVFGDIRDRGAVQQALRDCDVVFHTAGTVAVWGPALERMREIHLEGTRQVLQALAPRARLVHTSSVVAVGASRGREALTEASPFDLQHLKVDYVHAKKAAEDLALATVGTGSDVVVVNPAYLIGPEDFEGSVMGRMCVRFWKGKIPVIPPGALNFVDVRDVALGHLLAAEHGECGRRYILGGENLTMGEFFRVLASVRGMPSRWRFPMPAWLYALLACAAAFQMHVVQREPYPSMQHVRVSRYHWFYSSKRANAELGFEARPVVRTLEDAHEWYCRTGELKARTPTARPGDMEIPEAA